MLNMNHFLKGRNFKLYNIVNANENETRVTVHVTLEFQPMYSFTFSIVLPEHNGGTSRIIIIISAHLQVAKYFFLKYLLFGLSRSTQDLP